MLSLNTIYHASYVLKDVLHKTDLIHAPQINPKGHVYLKTENLQTTGSFKVRGAYYKISQLTDEEKARGVIACSAGNHAQGVALAAQRHDIRSVICLPDGVPLSKLDATRGYGAEICLVEGVYDDAYEKAVELQKEHGYTFIHPFDDEHVIAGQGTIALELVDQLPNVDAVIVPVGGGGLISGIGLALKSLNPNIKVYGVQAKGASSMLNSVRDHQIERLDSIATFADGIAVKEPGKLTFDLCNQYVDEIVSVTDDEISAAILMMIERQKLIAEGAGGVAAAAAMFNKVPIEGKNVVCILSGGNIDVTILSRVIKRGLLMSGRSCALLIELVDKPGQLKGVAQVIADLGGNIISVHHERANENSDVNGCFLRLELETLDFDHIETIRKGLVDAGYHLC